MYCRLFKRERERRIGEEGSWLNLLMLAKKGPVSEEWGKYVVARQEVESPDAKFLDPD
jgi:hypothetical protein